MALKRFGAQIAIPPRKPDSVAVVDGGSHRDRVVDRRTVPHVRGTGKAQKRTREQELICGSKAGVIKVSAFAGTGKTSTLCGFAEENAGSRILYVAFNKAIQVEASGRFPSHVTTKTAHSIAYGVCGHRYSQKLVPDIRPFHIQRHLERSLRDIPSPAHNLYGARVIETLKAYLVSADVTLGPDHVCIGNSPVELKCFDARSILRDAELLWAAMQRVDSDVPMLHDAYLKMYHVGARPLPYDVILLDEAQDTNPVTQAIVDAQSARKVYVGDKHQAIYSFRGATNAMESIDADEHHYLTGSFRFGSAIADVANSIMRIKGEDVRLQGYGSRSRVGFVPRGEGHAFIARGNCALFNRAVDCLNANEPFGFVGDIKNYRFDQIRDVFSLSVGEDVKDPFIRSFGGIGDLEEYAEATNDKELKSRCKVLAKYGAAIPGLISRIERSALPPSPGAGGGKAIILMTAHKSKGLEFDNVKLAGDFMPLLDEDGQLFDVANASVSDIEEINVQYVAATRARKVLQPGEKLEQYLDYVSSDQAQLRLATCA